MRKKWILTGIGVFLILAGLLFGYLLRFQSLEAVKELVNNLSGGTYQLHASKFKFNLLTFQINARDISISPTDQNSQNSVFEFKADSLSLQIKHPFQLLMFKRLSVHQLTLTHPYLELRTHVKDTTRIRKLRPLHQEISAMQDVLFNVLTSLQVDKFRLTDGTIAIYPETDLHQHRFFLNHIYLSLEELNLLKKVKHWDQSTKVAVDFRLLNPTIEYPDTSLMVVLDKLVWQSKTRRFELNGLDFHKRLQTYEEKSGFRLENIRLDSLNWNKLLNEGKLELGLLKASNGYFTSNDIRFKKSKDTTSSDSEAGLLEILGPIKIHQVSIDNIEFKGSTISRRGKESLKILGDNFLITNLTIDKNLPNKVELDDLELAVRGFLESDSSKSFQTGFDGMKIQKNILILENYFLRSFNKARQAQHQVSTRQLVFNQLSIPALLNGRIKARELLLVHPDIHIQLPKNAAVNRTNPLGEIRKALQKKLHIETIRIFSADILVTQKGRKSPLVNSSDFSAIISSKSLLEGGTLEQLFMGKNRLTMPLLTVSLNNIDVQLKNAEYENNNLYAEQVTGNSVNHGLQFDLKRVHIRDINAAGILVGKDTNWVRLMELGSGSISFRDNTNTQENNRKTKFPTELVRMIRLGKINLDIHRKDVQLKARLDSLAIDSLKFRDGKWIWYSYYLAGRDFQVHHPKWNTRMEHLQIGSGSGADIRNIYFTSESDRFRTIASIPVLQLQGSPLSLEEPLKGIHQVKMMQPVIHLHLKELERIEEKENESSSLTTLPAFELEHPTLLVTRDKNNQLQTIFKNEGGKINSSSIRLNQGTVQIDWVDLSLLQVVAIPERTNLTLGTFHLKAKQLNLDRHLKTVIENIEITQGKYHREKSEHQFRIDGIRVGNRAAISFSSRPEDLKKFLENLPHIDLEADSFTLVKGTRKWELFNPHINAGQKTIGFNSFNYTSHITRDSFFKQAPFQTDFIEFQTGKGRVFEYDRELAGTDTIWKANRLEFDQFNIHIDRDKRLPADSTLYRPLLADLVKSIPANVQIGTVLLTRSKVQYNEISEKTGKEGSVWFHDLNMVAGPIKNYGLSPRDSLKITATTKFMGEGNLRFAFQQSYQDSLKTFLMMAKMGPMPFRSLSPILLPLLNIDIREGRMDSLRLRAKGNDYFAIGHMELDYKKLKLSLLKENGEKKKFQSFLVNLVVKNRNRKEGVVYFERLRNKSTFNYWGKIALSGLLNNMGVRSNKKYIKKYKKEAQRLDIPAEFLD